MKQTAVLKLLQIQTGAKEGNTTPNSSALSFRYSSCIWLWKQSRVVSRKEHDLAKTICMVHPMGSAAKARLPQRGSRTAGAGTSTSHHSTDGVWPPSERGLFLIHRQRSSQAAPAEPPMWQTTECLPRPLVSKGLVTKFLAGHRKPPFLSPRREGVA